MWNLKRNETNELTKQKKTQRFRDITYGYQERKDVWEG